MRSSRFLVQMFSLQLSQLSVIISREKSFHECNFVHVETVKVERSNDVSTQRPEMKNEITFHAFYQSSKTTEKIINISLLKTVIARFDLFKSYEY